MSKMHLSEIEIVVDYLKQNILGTVINNIYSANDGTLFKLFGNKSVEGFFFSEQKGLLFPVLNIKPFSRVKISNKVESLRKYLKNKRVVDVKILTDFGKVVEIVFQDFSLKIPLFADKSFFIENNDNLIWPEKRTDLASLKSPLSFIEPRIKDPTQFAELFLVEQENLLKRKKEQIYQAKLKSLKKRLNEVTKDHQKALQNFKDFQEKANLIKANIYMVDPSSRNKCIDVYDFSGDLIPIELNPKISIADNMEYFFNKTKKSKRGVCSTSEILEKITRQIVDLEKSDVNEIEIVSGEKKSSKSKQISSHTSYHKFTTKKGRVFLVGKTNSDNDELTFKISSPHDLWFHTTDYPGSHVIMRRKKNEQPTDLDVIIGGSLAILYSKAKKSMEAQVWYCDRKFVRKKKGMAPGKVLLSKGKSKIIVVDKSLINSLTKEN